MEHMILDHSYAGSVNKGVSVRGMTLLRVVFIYTPTLPHGPSQEHRQNAKVHEVFPNCSRKCLGAIPTYFLKMRLK